LSLPGDATSAALTPSPGTSRWVPSQAAIAPPGSTAANNASRATTRNTPVGRPGRSSSAMRCGQQTHCQRRGPSRPGSFSLLGLGERHIPERETKAETWAGTARANPIWEIFVRLILVLLACVVAATSSKAAGTDADASRICSTCHHSQLPVNGGHAPGIACVTCHALKRPNFFGPGHRRIPSDCTSHHTTAPQVHPAPTHDLSPVGLRRRCLKCHDPHDSPNAHLTRPGLRVRGQLRPISFPPPDGAGSFVDLTHPGRGLCEVCHRETRFYRADG